VGILQRCHVVDDRTHIERAHFLLHVVTVKVTSDKEIVGEDHSFDRSL
jgi:hypothetical protein